MISKLTALKNHAGFIRYFKNTSWMMGEQFLRIIARLFVGIWVARYLGPEQFGLFSYVLAYTAIFAGIAKLGLDGILVRELVNHPEKRDTYLGTAFWLKILGAFIVMGLMAAIVPFTSNDATTNLFIFIIAAGLVFQSFEVVAFYFQSQVLAKIVSICKVIQLALSSIIKIYLVLTEAELIWFVLVTAFDALSLAVSYFVAYKINQHSSFYKHFDLSVAKQLLKDSWPIIFAIVAVSLYMKVDVVMINWMLGSHDAGIYSAATKLVETWIFIAVVITTSLAPSITKAKQNSKELFELRVEALIRVLVYIALLISIFISVYSESLVTFLFGDVFFAAGGILTLYVWSNVFIFMNNASTRWFINMNLQFYSASKVVVGAVLNVLLNYFWVPLYGLDGAVYATLTSYFFATFFLNLVMKNTRPLFYIQCKSLLPIFNFKKQMRF